jgi:hypothetical protein
MRETRVDGQSWRMRAIGLSVLGAVALSFTSAPADAQERGAQDRYSAGAPDRNASGAREQVQIPLRAVSTRYVGATPNLGTVTWSKDIAPIARRACQSCHRPGQVAPFSLLTYEDAKQWAPLMALRTKERRMPPWPIDKSIGIQHFKNDMSLTDEEIAKIGAWADAGAPEGNPKDAPPAITWPEFSDTWAYEQRFGRKPDLVIKSPAYKVVANGLDQWPNPSTMVTGLDKERWIMAIEFRPGNPESRYVFHHANPSMEQDGRSSGLLAAAVGKEGEIFPEDTGKKIKPGAKVDFGMHFYPIGKEVDAIMELGLWFYPEGQEPKFETPGQVQFRTDQSTGGSAGFPGTARDIARRADLLIPPNGHATYQGTYVLNRPTRIHDLRGHMHQRGMYQIVEAVYPDGRREIINKLDWDHAWHTTFLYDDDARPLLPKGTVLLLTSVFDNTSANRHNPDPDQWVVAGSRTVDEMAHIWIGLTYFDKQEDFDALVAEREQRLKAKKPTAAAASK